ncbi:MAG: HEPN domain-containing protein [Thermotogota bacterium]|nr:HEPN domain-containing protein [Thermotogota bacterium]
MTDFHGHLEVARAFLEIDEKFESMESFEPRSAYDIQIQGIFVQYMVVFITRTIEGSVKNIIHTKCNLLGKTESEIEEIEKNLKSFQNPSKEIINRYFKDILGIELDGEDFDNDYFASLGQIVNDRHKIAHSDHFLDTLQYLKSLDDVKKHYLNIKEFIAKLCEIISLC